MAHNCYYHRHCPSELLTEAQAKETLVREAKGKEYVADSLVQMMKRYGNVKLSKDKIDAVALVTREIRYQLRESFREYVKWISRDVAVEALSKGFLKRTPSERILRLVETCTFNFKEGPRVDMYQLIEFLTDLRALTTAVAIVEKFDAMDRTRTGFLSERQLFDVFLMGRSGTEALNEARRIVRLFDFNKDGLISRKEFVTIWNYYFDTGVKC